MQVEIGQLDEGQSGVVTCLNAGSGMCRRLRSVGIREGKTVTVLARHPLGGPVVVEVEGRHATIGRGMAHKILVERAPEPAVNGQA